MRKENNIYNFFYDEYEIFYFLNSIEQSDKLRKKTLQIIKNKKIVKTKNDIYESFDQALKKIFNSNLNNYKKISQIFENNNSIGKILLSTIIKFSILLEEWKTEIENLLNNKEQINEILEVILPFDFFEIKGSQKNFIIKNKDIINEIIKKIENNNNSEELYGDNLKRNFINWKNEFKIPSNKSLERILKEIKENISMKEKKLIQKIFFKRVSWKLWNELEINKKKLYQKQIKKFLIFLIKCKLQ